MIQKLRGNKGFTLVELMIAIVLSALSIKAIYEVYLGQKKTSEINEEIVGMQQNVRAALYYMEDEIKKAGLNPTERKDNGVGIVVADASKIQFTSDFTGGENDGIDNNKDGVIDEFMDGLDNDGDGLIDEADERREWYDGDANDVGENITYSLYDSQSDGDMDLGRLSGGGSNQPVANNIDVLDFVYLNGAGVVLGPLPLDSAGRENIRSVEITVVARAEKMDPDYTDSQAYFNRQGVEILAAPNDHYRRMVMTAAVKIRNLGLDEE